MVSSSQPATTTDHLSSLLRNASLTDAELFGAILSTIKSSKSVGRDAKQWIHRSVLHEGYEGYDAVSSIARRAAVGADGYVTGEDWIRQFGDAYQAFQSVGGEMSGEKSTSGGNHGRSLGDIVRDMPSDGHALRLRFALDAVDAAHSARSATLTEQPQSTPSSSSACSKIEKTMSVRQAVKLLRGTALVGNVELQSRALACLIRIVPRSASHPLEVLALVQTPTLRMLDWKSLEDMDGSTFFESESRRRFFESMINFGVEEEDMEVKNNGSTTCNSRNTDRNCNQKRKRPWEGIDESKRISSNSEKDVLMVRLVEAALLARRGDQRGAKHGAVLCVPADDSISTMEGIPIQSPIGLQRVIGRGWNHNILLDSSKSKNKIVLHSEVHAAADAIRRFGEKECFERLFPRATVLIVELVDDCAYETCHPCPKCNTFLRAVGITRAIHSTPDGTMDQTDMGPANPELLARDVARVPFCAACNEMEIQCKRLEDATKATTD